VDFAGNPAAFGFHVVGTGDFNGDGTTDILLQNGGGTLAEWNMQNGAVNGVHFPGNPAVFGFKVA
jgi:hypothetical protein